jgi:2-succinyl-6-hydroxy-2,4-cyclohexadiene-1-carboxylate synthase
VHWSLEHGMVVRRTGTGPRLVWLHGLGESSVSFESTVARLPGYEHVLVDLPGCGRSPWPAQAPSIEQVVDGIASWLAGDAPATLIGHSLGGVMATLVAERTPVRNVVDIDGNISRGDCTFSARAAAYSLDEFLAHGFAALRDDVFAAAATRAGERAYHAALAFASPHVFHRHAGELVALSERGSLVQRLASLGPRALFIAGVPDGICAQSRALLARHGVPTALIEPAGHWVYLDQPDAFAEALRAFL